MKKTLFAAVVTATLVAPSLALACEKPQNKPAIPDPSTAVTAQMIKSNNEVKAYVRAGEAYISCTANASEARRFQRDLKAFAEQFNKTIRAFKQMQS